jgi:hypothetical protein
LREGETLYLTCDGKGYPTPTIRWEKSSVELFSSGRMTVNNENLRITNVSLDDTGLYTCIVTNGEEKAEDDKSVILFILCFIPLDLIIISLEINLF